MIWYIEGITWICHGVFFWSYHSIDKGSMRIDLVSTLVLCWFRYHVWYNMSMKGAGEMNAISTAPAARYGCVKCQTYHYSGGDLFNEHILYQSKHGIERISVEIAMEAKDDLTRAHVERAAAERKAD